MSTSSPIVPPRSFFKSRDELCAFVAYKMRRASEFFTFKCSLYQRELKLYLPEPVPKHRRWIDTFDSDSIVLIPFSKIEKEEIELFRKYKPPNMDLDNIFPSDMLQRSFKKRISNLLTSLVNKIVFLLVLKHDTWYVHQEARDGIREYLVNKIWPKQPHMRLVYRDHVTTFVDTRIRHFRDSVGRYFRDLQANSKNCEVVSNMIVTKNYELSELQDMISQALEEQQRLAEEDRRAEFVHSPQRTNNLTLEKRQRDDIGESATQIKKNKAVDYQNQISVCTDNTLEKTKPKVELDEQEKIKSIPKQDKVVDLTNLVGSKSNFSATYGSLASSTFISPPISPYNLDSQDIVHRNTQDLESSITKSFTSSVCTTNNSSDQSTNSPSNSLKVATQNTVYSPGIPLYMLPNYYCLPRPYDPTNYTSPTQTIPIWSSPAFIQHPQSIFNPFFNIQMQQLINGNNPLLYSIAPNYNISPSENFTQMNNN
ncbi:hypothetical protein cand_025120 [Cryptosporidium andersoni]|uniref:Uncharacterized protein n=1 Tax=Cryptosporidium andersoni TaxID=117008 RepID=A0A1J4MAU5_9CRYT|nr:hypothetical protein cand_025120 [Cryptosporidium andersoni]